MGLMHKPSGLFGVGIFSTSQTNDTNPSAFSRQAGTRQDRLGRQQVSTATSSRPARPPSGAATARSTMASAKAAMQSRRHSRQRQPEAGTFVNIGTPVQITGSEVNRWFLALDQDFALRCVLHRRASLLLTNVPPSPGLPRPPLGAVFFCAPQASIRESVTAAPQRDPNHPIFSILTGFYGDLRHA